MRRIVFVVVMLIVWLEPGAAGRAAPLGTAIPANCVEHHGWTAAEADAPGDVRCAGLAIPFHTDGFARSPGPLWAGQWLFVDGDGQFRVGTCTFNLGVHPNVLARSVVVAQTFPKDATGAKSGYLQWRYGDTTDDLTAAALWAVFHFYAQDAAGSRRAAVRTAPLIASLDRLGAMTGNADLQARATALDAEAVVMAQAWRLSLSVGVDGSASVMLLAGNAPVDGARVVLHLDGRDDQVQIVTGADGTATVALGLTAGSQRVVATASAPGVPLVYRGAPAEPNPWGAQTLVTGGPPTTLSAAATVDVPAPPTTTVAIEPPPPPDSTTMTERPTTTTERPTTTTDRPTTTTDRPTTTTERPATTTTISPTTTALPTTTVLTAPTVPPTSTTGATTTTTSTPAAETVPTSTVVAVAAPTPTTAPGPGLPVTGAGRSLPAYVGTALLVGGIGLLGTIRRRFRPPPQPYFDLDT